MEVKTDIKYNAFISYSHAVDGRLAPALQNALHKIAKPWYQKRTLNIFRDETNLSASPQLWTNIESALRASQYFILLASPESAQSKWVQKEVDFWLRNKSIDTLLIGLTEGEVVWNNKNESDFDWLLTNALPRNLKNKFKEEPLYVDFRYAKSKNDLSLENPEFKKKSVILAASLHNKSVNDLVGEDVQQHRKAMGIRNSAITVLTMLLILSTITTWWARNQTKIAVEKTKFAELQQQIANDSTASAQQQRAFAQINAQMARDSAGYARQQANFAKEQQQIAETQRNIAVKAQFEAEAQKKIAEIQRDSAHIERDIAEANRIATQALNIKATNPNVALRIAETAYKMHTPPLPNTSVALSSIFYDFFQKKVVPYERQINLGKYKVKDAWLLANDKGIVFNSGLLSDRDSTYFLSFNDNRVQKLTKCSHNILLSPDRNFFIVNYDKYGNHPSCRNEPITLWSNSGEFMTELNIQGDTINEVRILPICNKIVAETKNGKVAVFTTNGKLEKILTSPTTTLNLTGTYEGKKWCTPEGEYFFTTGEGSFIIWDSNGNLVKQIKGENRIWLADVSSDGKHFLLSYGNEFLELASLTSKEKVRLEYSNSEEGESTQFHFSTKGKYIIGTKTKLKSAVKGDEERELSKFVVWNSLFKGGLNKVKVLKSRVKFHK